MAKKKAGSYNTPITKASNLLPQVFNTDVNKKWLDSTLDQMISKGNLTNVEGYIGDQSGKNRYTNDVYLANANLSSAIVVTDKDNTITDTIAMSDIANAINTNFSEYNYNTAYATKSYSYRPPITIDKFVNYQNYAWVDQMPTYESIRTLDAATVGSVTSGSEYPASPAHGDYFALNDGINTKTYQWDNNIKTWQPSGDTGSIYTNNGNNAGFTSVVNPLDLSAEQLSYIVTDNNNTFEMADQLIIKFVGDGWHTDAHEGTYLITGTGRSIKLFKLYDWRTNSTTYPDTTKTTVTVGGIWDKSKVFTVQPNQQSKLWTDANMYHPIAMIDYYNADANRLPIFDGFTFPSEDSNKNQWIEGELVMFAEEWTSITNSLEFSEIYYTTVDNVTGDVGLTKLVEAVQPNGNQKVYQRIVPGTSEEVLAKYKDRLSGFDILNWDKSTVVFTEKDYQVIETDSSLKTAWSRNNKWTNIKTLQLLDELIYGGIDLKTLTDAKYMAKRPIMEFDGTLNLYDFAEANNLGDNQWLLIDAMVKPTGDYELETVNGQTQFKHKDDVEWQSRVEVSPNNTRIAFTEGPLADKTWTLNTNYELVAEIQLTSNYCAYVREALPDTEDRAWNNSDIWFNGTTWATGQQRLKTNQMPLFKLYTIDGTPIETLQGSFFTGSRIFNYKIGSGIPDAELGIALSYKDVNGIGEYQFENYLFTETYAQSITSNFNRDRNQRRHVLGQKLFKLNGKLTNLYRQSEEISGAKTLVTHDVDSVSSDFTIKTGHSSWRADRRVVLHQQDNRCVVTEIQNGVYLDKTNVDHTNIYVGKDIPIVFNNLLKTGDVRFKTVAGVDIETTPQAGVTVTRSGNDITLALTTYSSKIIIDPADATLTNDYTIIPLDYYDSIQHTVEVNGKLLSADNYTINADTIVIPKEKLNVGDIVDLKYASSNNANRTTNSSIPNTLKHNANNEVVTDFTMSETIAHWKDIISSTPGFEGEVFGVNNYEAINKQHYFGGEIFIYNDLSIVHDALYASDKVNISDSLRTSGEDWDNFKNRFRNQVARLYQRKSYLTVQELVDDAIQSIIITRSGGNLFKTSNMVYKTPIRVEEFLHKDGDEVLPRIFLKDNIHSDDNIQDHVYVYISDNVGDVLTTRLAVKDIDYTQTGNTIEFIYQPIAMPNKGYPKITVYRNSMDEVSHVPPSLTKLKLAPGYSPEVRDNVLTGHDGTKWKLNTNAELFIMTDSDFDVINACQFDLEKRIHTGLVISDRINTDDQSVESLQYGMVSKFMPSKSRETWYTLETIDDALYKSFKQWKAKYNRTEPTRTYSSSDKTTWNWSAANISGHFKNNKLPGHWTGAYEVLFGTQTPHLTPWHMLGYAFKPTWWDTYYSWTDAAKRNALKEALKRGLVSTGRQDIEWANNMWDWNTQCPVKADGTLEDIEIVLGSVSSLNAQKDFVFGDWAGLEAEWRASASGKAALIDAIIKLNPTKASSIFYSPSVKVTDKSIDYLSKDNLEIYKASSIATPGKVYGRSVTDVELTVDVNELFDTTTFIKLVGPTGSTDCDVSLAFDNRNVYPSQINKRLVTGASISHRGRNLTPSPVIYTSISNSQIEVSTFTFKTAEVEYVASGIAQSLHNYALRNNVNYNLDNLHTSVTTRLGTQLHGFSSKHLLEFRTQTFDDTNHTLGENDFELAMYQSTPINIAIASEITIENKKPGWKITGSGYGKQQFNFFAPDNTNTTSYESVSILGTEVKKYNKFAPVHSILEYDATLSKIQDTYSFIRGYYAYLESIGFEFPYSGDSVAAEFVKWALGNNATTKTFELGSNFKFKPAHGSVTELNSGVFKENTVTDSAGITIDIDNLLASRTDNTLSLETKDKTVIGSAGFVVVENEHIALLNNKTTFGVVVNDDVKNIIQEKIAFRGLITDRWDGQKRAPGYLVFDDKIVENFDSSVQAIDDYYKTDGVDFNPSIRKIEDITIGNSNNELTISENEFDSITRRNYFQGLIKQRGTQQGFDSIERKFVKDKLDVKVHEQYMLSRSYFGNTDKLDAVEFTLESNSFETSPQAIKFTPQTGTIYNDVLVYAPGDKRFVNPFKTTPSYATKPITNVNVTNLTAGALLDTEAKYKTNLLSEIGNVYDESEDYANIETWANNKSYKLNNLVRYKGALYKCNVDSTTVTTPTDSIKIIGSTPDPVFPSGTVVNIDTASFPLEKIEQQTQPITAIGSALTDPVLKQDGTKTLLIDGQPVTLSNKGDVAVHEKPAEVLGSLSSPAFDSQAGFVTGKQLVIGNGVTSVTVDFDTTPADKTETFAGDNLGVTPADKTENITATATQTYTISQALSVSTYSVSSVTVDGTANTNYSVSGQNITFTSPTFTGGEAIVVTMTHVTVVDLEDTFTIAQDIVSSSWSVKSITVDGAAKTSPAHYSISGQTLTFTSGNEPADGDVINVILEHVPDTMNATQIVTTINNALINGGFNTTPPTGAYNGAILADLLAPDNRLRIRYWSPSLETTDTNHNLVIGSSVNGTNEVFGFPSGSSSYPVGIRFNNQEQDMTLDQVVTAINNTANIPYITATNESGQLKLVSDLFNTSWTDRKTTLTVGGTEQTTLGMATTYNATTQPITVDVPTTEAIIQITAGLADPVAAGGSGTAVSGVTVSGVNTFLNIASDNSTLVLSTDTSDVFLNLAGIDLRGTIELIIDETQQNAFVDAEWINVSHEDPALFNVWVANDSDYMPEAITGAGGVGVETKHYGWNVLQVQSRGFYTADLQNDPNDPLTKDEPCGICAGTMTADGNDAQVTVDKNHGLVVGDYVMLLNTTTTPNIDGIHKVTKIGSSTEFYIDQYIDKCGSSSSIMMLRPTRFKTIEQRDAALKSINWNIPPQTLIFTDFDIAGVTATRSINVFKSSYPKSGGSALTGKGYTDGYLYTENLIDASVVSDTTQPVRNQTSRILNTDLDNITVYDYDTNTPILDLELFDPMRGIIPGVADAEIDIRSVHDVAIYNTATEETYEADEDNAWSEAEVGKRWWDTSKVRYYDYDQGDLKDKSSNWGKQFIGSEVVIWEWTKSSVAPDDYSKAVDGAKEMYGVVASGTAYAEFDAVKNQNEYYYTLRSEWNASTSKYDSVYYFWVRGKETIGSTTKNIITSEVENIITDPSANGIYWFSVVDTDAIIVSDIWDFVNKKVVLQLNKQVDNNHSQWILVGKDTDTIPDYWFTGLKNNLAQIDENSLRLPDFTRHPYIRYGDDRAIRQAWYDDIIAARLNAVDIINRLLLNVNVYNDFKFKFESALVNENIPNDTWEWTDFVLPDHNFTNTYSTVVKNIEELNALDTTEYETAKIQIINDDDVDRTEYYIYKTDTWVLSKKNNATISWNKDRLAQSYAWDLAPWDSITWDNTTIANWWKSLVTILRDTLFVNEHTTKFNKFFIGMVDYALSRTKQVEWAMKTSYIRLEVKSDLVEKKKYKKDLMSSIEGYVNEIKPFHVKVSESNRTFNKLENVSIGLTEDRKTSITTKVNNSGTNFNGLVVNPNGLEKDIVLDINGTTIQVIPFVYADMSQWDITAITDGNGLIDSADYFIVDQAVNFTTPPAGPTVTISVVYEDEHRVIITGGDGNTVYDDADGYDGQYGILDGGVGIQPHMYTLDNNGQLRSTDADIRPQSATVIKVQTNRTGSTDTNETKTFAYIIDVHTNEHVYGLLHAKTSTIAADLEEADTTITLDDPSKFTTAEFVLVENELIHVQYATNGRLNIIQRGVNLTLAHNHEDGCSIIDVTGNQLHYVDSPADKRFNDDNTTILDSSTTAEAQMLNRLNAQGTIL